MSALQKISRPDTVPATEASVPVFAPVTDGSSQLMGMYITRTYEGENVCRHFFIPADKPEKEYSIGHTTGKFQFIDHEAAIRPLLDRGYQIETARFFRGGLDAHFVLSPSEGGFLADPITWDSSFWGSRSTGTEKGMKESLVVNTSLRPGKGINYDRGFFRLVCTNGLVAKVLDLGGARFTHTSWGLDALVKGLFGPTVKVTDDITLDQMRGPLVGNTAGAGKLASVLNTIADATASNPTDEDSDEEAPIPVQLPYFISKATVPFQNQPSWYIGGLAEQFEAIANSGQGNVYAIDLVNAITNPINLAEEGRSLRRPTTRSNRLVEAAIQLTGALSI